MLFFHFPDAGRIAPIRGSVFVLEETLTLMEATRPTGEISTKEKFHLTPLKHFFGNLSTLYTFLI